ncbi:MAG: hypothetical protein ACJ8MH_09735 [Povalibacter sp.]
MTQHRETGNAMAESIVALLALSPFIVGIPLLGKQLDIKHKSYDSARYSVWERTVWRSDGASNRKSEDDITLETRDRALGSPLAGVLDVETLRSVGITENSLWRDRQRERLLNYENTEAPIQITYREQPTPVDVGYWLVPGIAYGTGVLGTVQRALHLDSLNLNQRTFARSSAAIGIRPSLGELADRKVSLGDTSNSPTERGELVLTSTGALLSDTWASRDEDAMRRRVDDVTVNELIEQLELPGKPIGMQALGKGKQLFGEGQFGWDPDLRPRSSTLPSAYIDRR